MNDRERWTVYPLLFLTLGITVKDKLLKLVDVDNVRCNRLVVTDTAGHDRVVIAAGPTGGVMQLDSDQNAGKILLGYIGNRAGLTYVDPQGRLQIDPQGKLQPWQVTPVRSPQRQPENQRPEDPAEPAAAEREGNEAPAEETPPG